MEEMENNFYLDKKRRAKKISNMKGDQIYLNIFFTLYQPPFKTRNGREKKSIYTSLP